MALPGVLPSPGLILIILNNPRKPPRVTAGMFHRPLPWRRDVLSTEAMQVIFPVILLAALKATAAVAQMQCFNGAK